MKETDADSLLFAFNSVFQGSQEGPGELREGIRSGEEPHVL